MLAADIRTYEAVRSKQNIDGARSGIFLDQSVYGCICCIFVGTEELAMSGRDAMQCQQDRNQRHNPRRALYHYLVDWHIRIPTIYS